MKLERRFDQLEQAINQVVDAARNLLDQLSKIFEQTDQEQRQAHMREIHRVDPLRGDFQHRTNGKRPLEHRFRDIDEEPRSFETLEGHFHPQRTTREKSDLRRGRRQN
jgi:hypothetical protein